MMSARTLFHSRPKKNGVRCLVALALTLAFCVVVPPAVWTSLVHGKVIALAWGLAFLLQMTSCCILLEPRIRAHSRWANLLRCELILLPVFLMTSLLTAHSGLIDPESSARLLFGLIVEGVLCVIDLRQHRIIRQE